jgi:phage-related protein
MESLEKIEHALFGNVRPGLLDRVKVLEVKQESMNEDVRSLATSYSGLVKSLDKHLITEKAKLQLKQKMLSTWKFVAVVISTAAVVVGIILKF